MREAQSDEKVKGADWISWHEGAHLITKNPSDCPSFLKI